MASSGNFNTSGYGSGDWFRCINFYWEVSSQSISNNTSTISWRIKGVGGATNNYYMAGNFAVVINGSTVYSSATRIQLWNGTRVASGTFTLSHNSAGDCSFSAAVQAGIYTVAVNCSGSGSWSLPQIKRASKINSFTGNDVDGNFKATYTSYNSGWTNKLRISIPNVIALTTFNYSSGSVFQLSAANKEYLYNYTKNAKSVRLGAVIETWNGGTKIGESSELVNTVNITNANPTFTVAYADDNPTTVAITGNDQLIVRNQSQLEINISNAEAKKSATLASATCVINGTTYNATFSGSSATFNIGLLNVSSDTTATVTVTDSRGFSTSQELPITVLDWTLPTAITTMHRHNNYYTPTDITVDGSYSSVDGKNSMTIKVRYKKVSESTWSSYTTVQDNVMQTFQLDNESAWDVQVLVTDLFGSSTYNLTLNRGLPIIYFDNQLSSVGVNCFPTEEKSLEVSGVNVMRSVMTRNLAANITSPSVNTYTKIAFTGTNSFGGKLTATNDGGIEIGAGVSKILVSGRMLMSTSVAGSSYIRICKNSTDNTAGWVTHTNNATSATFDSLAITPLLMDVEEGDVIYMYYYVPASSITIYGTTFGNQTSLTVETIG